MASTCVYVIYRYSPLSKKLCTWLYKCISNVHYKWYINHLYMYIFTYIWGTNVYVRMHFSLAQAEWPSFGEYAFQSALRRKQMFDRKGKGQTKERGEGAINKLIYQSHSIKQHWSAASDPPWQTLPRQTLRSMALVGASARARSWWLTSAGSCWLLWILVLPKVIDYLW